MRFYSGQRVRITKPPEPNSQAQWVLRLTCGQEGFITNRYNAEPPLWGVQFQALGGAECWLGADNMEAIND